MFKYDDDDSEINNYYIQKLGLGEYGERFIAGRQCGSVFDGRWRILANDFVRLWRSSFAHEQSEIKNKNANATRHSSLLLASNQIP